MKTAEIHQLFLESNGISTDTRKIGKGSIFFALKGENFDGNKFATQALENGAAFAVVEKVVEPHINFIPVADVLQTLQELANFHRKYLKVPIIGLTGSNGKTTTKELINAVLSEKFKTTATQGNFNNHIGVPLTLLSMTKNTEIGLVEMGANHAGEIALLCEIAEPDYGFITNFGKAHLEGFGGIAGVIKAKSELYDFLKNHEKTIFMNSDDALQIRQSRGATSYSFGENKDSDQRIEFLEANPFVEMSIGEILIKSQLIGKYNAKNIAAAVGIGSYFSVKPLAIKKAVEGYSPNNNRSQMIEKNGNQILLDAYNANPTSMAAALESFASLKTKKQKVLILGDMFEVGEDSAREHQLVIQNIESLGINKVFLCGNNFFRTTGGPAILKRFAHFEGLNQYLISNPILNSFILIKGSRGMKLERVLENL